MTEKSESLKVRGASSYFLSTVFEDLRGCRGLSAVSGGINLKRLRQRRWNIERAVEKRGEADKVGQVRSDGWGTVAKNLDAMVNIRLPGAKIKHKMMLRRIRP